MKATNEVNEDLTIELFKKIKESQGRLDTIKASKLSKNLIFCEKTASSNPKIPPMNVNQSDHKGKKLKAKR